MILLHGNFASPRWWEPVREHLPCDVPVLVPDMRAWVDNGRVTITTLADRLARLIRTQDLRQPVVVGHSLGGVVTTQFALDHPDQARALVLIDTGPPEGVPLGRFVTKRRLPWNWLRRRAMRAALGRAGLPRRHPLAEALVDDALETDPAVYAAFSHAVARWNVSERLNGLTLPTLLIWGERDPVMPLKIGQRLNRLLPDSRLVTLPGVGHSPPVEAPQAVVTHLLAFLDERGPRPQPAGPTKPRGPWDKLRGWLHRVPN